MLTVLAIDRDKEVNDVIYYNIIGKPQKGRGGLVGCKQAFEFIMCQKVEVIVVYTIWWSGN